MPDENFWDNDPVSTPAAPTVPTVGTAPSGGNFWDNDPVVPKAASAPTGIYAPIKNYTTLKYLGGNGRGTSYAPLLQDIHKAAEGLGLTLGISSAYRPGAVTTSGHTSRHASQHAVDISTINGFPVTDPQGKALGDMLAARLKSMGFETGEHGTNRGLLWQTMVGGNHFNHLHVSYPSSATIPAGAMGMIPGVAGALTAPAKKPVPIPAQALQMVPGIAGALATPAKKTPAAASQPTAYNPVLGIPTPPPASQFAKSIKPSTYPGPLQEALENAAAEAGLTPEQYRQGVKKYGIAAVEKGAAGRQAQAQYQQQISGGIEAIPGLIDRPFTSALAGVPIEQAPSNLLSALSERSQPGSAQALEEMPGFLPGVAKTLSSFVTPSNAALMKLLGPVNKGATALGEKIAGMGAEAGRTRAQEIALKMAGKAIQQGPLAPFAVESVKGAIQQARAGDPWGAVGSLAAFFGPMAIHDYVAAVAKDNPKLITPAQARTFYQDAFSAAKEGPKSVKRPSPVDVTQKAIGQMTEADVDAALQKSTPPTFRNAEQYNMPTPAETPPAPAAQEPPATPLPATETGATPPNVSQPVPPVSTTPEPYIKVTGQSVHGPNYFDVQINGKDVIVKAASPDPADIHAAAMEYARTKKVPTREQYEKTQAKKQKALDAQFMTQTGSPDQMTLEDWRTTRSQFQDRLETQRADAAQGIGETYSGLSPEEKAAFDAATVRLHREAVQQALRIGKPIRPEVMADYPDLAKGQANAVQKPEAGSVLQRQPPVETAQKALPPRDVFNETPEQGALWHAKVRGLQSPLAGVPDALQPGNVLYQPAIRGNMPLGIVSVEKLPGKNYYRFSTVDSYGRSHVIDSALPTKTRNPRVQISTENPNFKSPLQAAVDAVKANPGLTMEDVAEQFPQVRAAQAFLRKGENEATAEVPAITTRGVVPARTQAQTPQEVAPTPPGATERVPSRPFGEILRDAHRGAIEDNSALANTPNTVPIRDAYAAAQKRGLLPEEMTLEQFVQAGREWNTKANPGDPHMAPASTGGREGAVRYGEDRLAYVRAENETAPKPTLQKASNKGAPKEKVNARGFTEAQENFLVNELKRVAQDFPTVEQIRAGAKTEPVTIKVPGDGTYTVDGVQQAVNLHASLTGKPIPGIDVKPDVKKFSGNLPNASGHVTIANALKPRPEEQLIPLGSRKQWTAEKPRFVPEKVSETRYGRSYTSWTVRDNELGITRGSFDSMGDAEKKAAGWNGMTTAPKGKKGSTLQASLIPGLNEYLEQDVIPIARKAPEAVMSVVRNIRDFLSPASASKEAGQTANIIRANAAELARKTELTHEALAEGQRAFRNTLIDRPPVVNGQVDVNHPAIKFIDAIEQGNVEGLPPAVRGLAEALRKGLDARVAEVQKLGKLDTVIENYFPHIWKDPKQAEDFLSTFFAKRPMEGPKSFLKQRTIPTTLEGLARGLEPVTFNPVDLALLKMREMDRWIFAHKSFNEMKDAGIAKYVTTFGEKPEGYAKLDDRIAQVVQIRPTVKVSGEEGAPEMILRGHWYAPEPAAKVFNNYLSPGLRGQPLYEAVSGVGNAMNQAQLGLSGFHLTFTTLDAMVSKVALGLEQMSRGNVLRGAGNVVKGVSPYAPIENIIRGDKVLREYLNPGKLGGETAQIVDALQAGGGRVRMDSFYKNSAVEKFWTALEGHNYPGALLRAPFAILEQTAKPLMEYVVPRQKLGVFADMARMEMERLGPNASKEQVREAMARAWDSVDNRMGQLVYDNLFWQKTLKDLGLISTRSLGWNLGTIRELGGAGVDTATTLKRLRAGDPVLTHRMAYAMALPATVALYGAMMTYLYTGRGPTQLLDYFQPPTGERDKNGQPVRVQLPSYMRDIVPDVRAGQRGFQPLIERMYEQVSGKRHPLIDMVSDMLGNKNFYGEDIRNEKSPLVQQLQQEAAFVGSQFLPYSFRTPPSRRVETTGQKAQRFFGIVPAPKDIAPADRLYAEAMRKLVEAKQKGAVPRPRVPKAAPSLNRSPF